MLKKAAGKKGSIYEESYLLKSLKKSIEDKVLELQSEFLPVSFIAGRYERLYLP